MKRMLGVLAVLVLSLSLSFAQSTGSQSANDTNRAADQPVTRTDNDARNDHGSWGWVGLLGLAGLAGLAGRHRRDNVGDLRDDLRDREARNIRNVA